MGSRLLSTLIKIVMTAGLVLVVLVGARAMVPEWNFSLNPFQDETVDNSGPSVLKSLSDLSEYHAASGHYETVVDRRVDTNRLPDWVSGERVLYVGKGDVDAIVDFSHLDEQRIEVSPDRTSVKLRLPAPTVGKPTLDIKNSYVVDRDSGFITKFKGSDLEREAQLKALEQMAGAATGEGSLVELAKRNTTSMLRGLFGSLGFTDVMVSFDADVR
jgi:hypothetical protein